ncbi:MAG: hypothetical protein JKY88_05930 [Pseudomonadales bacterium]|nr:hypothetical protein [Pseudomonadales bacterium]
MSNCFIRVPLTLLFLYLSGCASLIEAPNPTFIQEILQHQNNQAQEPVDILALSSDLKIFVDKNIDRSWSSSRRLIALREILFSAEYFDLQYETGRTKTATETYEARSGNCLSMTSLFIAMARYSGLDANYHIVDTIPQWDTSGNTLILTRHINSVGRLRNGDSYILDFLPNLRRHHDTASTVSDDYALAIYYNNLAAEAIIDKRHHAAINFLMRALELEPKMTDVWNNMGILQQRLKRLDLAEASFKQAFILDKYNHAAASNLSKLYLKTDKEEKADRLLKRVTRYRERNPYYRYASARIAYANQNYASALEELVKAIRIKKNEIVFFELLSQIHSKLGNQQKEVDSLKIVAYLDSKKPKTRSSLEIRHPGSFTID